MRMHSDEGEIAITQYASEEKACVSYFYSARLWIHVGTYSS